MALFWISFRKHGVVILEAEDERAALTRTHALKLNPGSEAITVDCDTLDAELKQRLRSHMERLIPKVEVERIFGECASGEEIASAIEAQPEFSVFCEHMNAATKPH